MIGVIRTPTPCYDTYIRLTVGTAEEMDIMLQALQQRRRGGDQDAAGLPGQRREHAQPFRDDVLVRREVVPGQGLPLDEMQHRQVVAAEEANLGLELVRMARILREHQQ